MAVKKTTTGKATAKSTPAEKKSKWEYTPKNDGEAACVLVEQEQEQYNRHTGKKTSQRHTQWYDQRAFLLYARHCRQLGFTHVKVLYAPDNVDISIIPPMPTIKGQ